MIIYIYEYIIYAIYIYTYICVFFFLSDLYGFYDTIYEYIIYIFVFFFLSDTVQSHYVVCAYVYSISYNH